jgi:hypothetical protein
VTVVLQLERKLCIAWRSLLKLLNQEYSIHATQMENGTLQMGNAHSGVIEIPLELQISKPH